MLFLSIAFLLLKAIVSEIDSCFVVRLGLNDGDTYDMNKIFKSMYQGEPLFTWKLKKWL
jgi:hypothetical protein